MEEKFIRGLFTSRRENAPEFLLASLSFKTDHFIEWLKDHTNANGYCNVDVLRSYEGKVYSKYNNWQPKKEESFVKTPEGKIKVVEHLSNDELFEPEDIKVDELPF